MYLAIYDPDKKVPAITKLTEAIERYRDKFGREPVECLTSYVDAEALTDAPIPVRGVSFISRHTFYVGTEDAA
jgi:hypothetical protein